jgi:CheY-like chemotaxis protein
VLVVVDNRDAALTVAAGLELLGYDVRIAHDGPSALEVARGFNPHVCLLDIGLPVMDGYELARRLRAEDGPPGPLRLIALTGYGQESDRRRSLEAGFDAHAVKPVTLDVLERMVTG